MPGNETTLTFWLEELKFGPLAMRKEHTCYLYDNSFRQFTEFLRHVKEDPDYIPAIDDLTEKNIMGAVNWWKHEKGLAWSTVGKIRDNIGYLWEYVWRRGELKTGPMLPAIKMPKKPPVSLTPEQLLRVWEVASFLPGRICEIPESLWWQSRIATHWSTGERVEPFFLAEQSEFNLERAFWTVPAEHRKGGEEFAQHRLHPGAVALLARMREYGHKKMWPMYFHWVTLYARLGRIMVEAGLPNDRQHKFHLFRRTVVTLGILFGDDEAGIVGKMRWRDPSMIDNYRDQTIAPKPSLVDGLPFIGDLGKRTG